MRARVKVRLGGSEVDKGKVLLTPIPGREKGEGSGATGKDFPLTGRCQRTDPGCSILTIIPRELGPRGFPPSPLQLSQHASVAPDGDAHCGDLPPSSLGVLHWTETFDALLRLISRIYKELLQLN